MLVAQRGRNPAIDGAAAGQVELAVAAGERLLLQGKTARPMAGAAMARHFDQIAPRAMRASAPGGGWNGPGFDANSQRHHASGQCIESGQTMTDGVVPLCAA